MKSLFDKVQLGNMTLENRIFMAPLTRMRSKQPGNIPHKLNAKYYGQRATAGLIVSEATQISQQGQGYPATPGIYTPEQVEGWKLVTDAVHEEEGKIFLQLWHVGRISHSSFQVSGTLPVAPSSIKPSGKTMTASWKQEEYETPHALSLEEIKVITSDYATACNNAQEAGFDGVEVHGANGYLLDQFLHDGSNQRTDEYGGSIANRCRLLLEVIDVAISIWGRWRVGVRLSPYGTFNDMSDSDTLSLFSYLVDQLNLRQIAYIHMIEPRATTAGGSDAVASDAPSAANIFRKMFDGFFISAGGYSPESAKACIENDIADAVAFGRLYIANPDLPERIMAGAPLNPYNRATFYGGTEIGYTDYPFLKTQ